MLAQPEHRRTLRRLVTPDALKDRAAIADDVGKDMKLSLMPSNELSVVPDFLGGL